MKRRPLIRIRSLPRRGRSSRRACTATLAPRAPRLPCAARELRHVERTNADGRGRCRRRVQVAGARRWATAGWLRACGRPDAHRRRAADDHRHARDLPGARDAGVPFGPRRLRVRDAGTGLGRDRARRHATRRRRATCPRVAQRRRDRRLRAVRARRRLRRRGACAAARGRDGDGYVLDGEKTWICNGGIADFYVRVRAYRARRRGRAASRRSSSMRARRASRSPSASR